MGHTKFIHTFLEDSADRSTDKKAFFAVGNWHTYGELNTLANRLAHLFLEQGLQKGDRVALFIENSAEYIVSYYAVLKAGGITVALNTENIADDVAYIARDCDVRFLIASHRLAARTLMSAPADPFLSSPTSGTGLKAIFVWNGPKEGAPSILGVD